MWQFVAWPTTTVFAWHQLPPSPNWNPNFDFCLKLPQEAIGFLETILLLSNRCILTNSLQIHLINSQQSGDLFQILWLAGSLLVFKLCLVFYEITESIKSYIEQQVGEFFWQLIQWQKSYIRHFQTLPWWH